jgi:hypothetical protein
MKMLDFLIKKGISNSYISKFSKKKPLVDFTLKKNLRFLGRGLITETNNEHWKVKRALLNPGFHKKYSFLH